MLRQLGHLNLAYIHIVEGATGGPRELPDRPFDYDALKAAYRAAGGKGAWMLNNAYTRELAEQVTQASRMSSPPKQMLVTIRSGKAKCS